MRLKSEETTIKYTTKTAICQPLDWGKKSSTIRAPMSNMWQKIVSMVRKTGDRCIVFDSQTEEAFVVMDFGSYERIIECDPDMEDGGCCGGCVHEPQVAEAPETIILPKIVSIQPEKSIPAPVASVKPAVVPSSPPPARLTPKPIPDTINPDFDIPIPEVPEELDDQAQENFADLSEESVGTPTHFYLEPIE